MEEIASLVDRVEAIEKRLNCDRFNIKKFRASRGPIFVGLELEDLRRRLHLKQLLCDSLLNALEFYEGARPEKIFIKNFGLEDPTGESIKELQYETRRLRNEAGIEEKQIKAEILTLANDLTLVN